MDPLIKELYHGLFDIPAPVRPAPPLGMLKNVFVWPHSARFGGGEGRSTDIHMIELWVPRKHAFGFFMSPQFHPGGYCFLFFPCGEPPFC